MQEIVNSEERSLPCVATDAEIMSRTVPTCKVGTGSSGQWMRQPGKKAMHNCAGHIACCWTDRRQRSIRGQMATEAVDFPLHMVSLRSEEHTSELQSRENLVCR